MTEPNGDHAHTCFKALPYGLDVCACGAVMGLDGRWRRIDPPGPPQGACRHPAARAQGARLVCVSCGIDGGAYPLAVSRPR